MEKKCEICGGKFTDNSINQAKKTCSNACRYILYNKSNPEKYFKRLIEQRRFVLAQKGCNLSENDLIAIETKLSAGICEMCGKPTPLNDLCIDHDHITNKYRGVICSTCNHFLGYFEYDKEIVTQAIKYLQYK